MLNRLRKALGRQHQQQHQQQQPQFEEGAREFLQQRHSMVHPTDLRLATHILELRPRWRSRVRRVETRHRTFAELADAIVRREDAGPSGAVPLQFEFRWRTPNYFTFGYQDGLTLRVLPCQGIVADGNDSARIGMTGSMVVRLQWSQWRFDVPIDLSLGSPARVAEVGERAALGRAVEIADAILGDRLCAAVRFVPPQFQDEKDFVLRLDTLCKAETSLNAFDKSTVYGQLLEAAGFKYTSFVVPVVDGEGVPEPEAGEVISVRSWHGRHDLELRNTHVRTRSLIDPVTGLPASPGFAAAFGRLFDK